MAEGGEGSPINDSDKVVSDDSRSVATKNNAQPSQGSSWLSKLRSGIGSVAGVYDVRGKQVPFEEITKQKVAEAIFNVTGQATRLTKDKPFTSQSVAEELGWSWTPETPEQERIHEEVRRNLYDLTQAGTLDTVTEYEQKQNPILKYRVNPDSADRLRELAKGENPNKQTN